MAYTSKNLSVLAYANGFTLWHYTTPDTAVQVGDPAYFDPAADMLRAGDVLVINVDTNNMVQTGFLTISASDSDSSTVTVAGMTNLSSG